VITLPKRKLRLWYSKNDYIKERENEKKLNEPIQSDNVAKPVFKEEMTETSGIDKNIPAVESGETPMVEVETKLPKAETQSEILPTDTQDNAQHVEMSPAPMDRQSQVSEKNGPAQTQITNEQEPIVNENIEATPTQTDEKTLETSPTELEKQTAIQKENPPTIDESSVQAIEAPSEPENRESTESTKAPPAFETIREVVPVESENKVPLTASVENIEKYTDSLKHLLPTKAVICIGEYPINIVLKGSFEGKKDEGVLPIFVEKSTKDVIKWSQGRLDQNNIVCLDEDIDTHFWYDILPYIADNENFFAKVKSKPIDKLRGAIIISSTWNGIGSALLPSLNAQFKEWKINSIALPLLPSKAQPLDGQFNTFASLGILASKQDTALLLVDRDNLESYIGVDRKGYAINGNSVTNYLLDLMLAKETFVSELCEMSKSFGSKMFTVLLASGLSLKIYDSLENMLNTTLIRPLFTFDLSTSTLLYVLIRLPLNLKDTLTRGKIELAMANWFENKADLESIYIADPVYVDESNDRIDIALFVGGFETAARFAALEKRIEKMKNKAVKKGLVKEEDWQLITKSLLE